MRSWTECVSAAVGLAIGLCVAGTAGAEADERDPARPGAYVGLGAAYTIEHFRLDSERLELAATLGPGVDPRYDDSVGVDVQAGYRLGDAFAVDFLYQWIEGFDSTAGLPGTPGTEIDAHQLTLSGRWFPPALRQASGRLQTYVFAGVGLQIVNSEVLAPTVRKPYRTDAGFVGRIGGGIDYYLTPSLVLEFEAAYGMPAGGWVRYTRYSALAFRLQHRF